MAYTHRLTSGALPILPQELVDHIIDYLYNLPWTLAACSLVHRTWFPRARYYLFRTIHINGRNCSSLLAILKAPPTNTFEYVRTVTASPNWGWHPALDEINVHNQIEAAVCGIMAHTEVHSLSLDLNHLRILRDTAASTSAFAHISELTLRGDSTTLIQSCAFPRLRRLALHTGVPFAFSDNVSSGSPAGHTLFPQLHTLALHFDGTPISLLLWLAVRPPPALHTLHVRMAQRWFGVTHSLQRFLDALPMPLDTLTVDLSLIPDLDLAHARPRIVAIDFHSGGGFWMRLVSQGAARLTACDEALAALPTLRKIRIALPLSEDISDTALEAHMRTIFVRCDARGLLEFVGPEEHEEFGA